MSSSGSSLLVDDSDPHVQYQPGWIWDQGVAEVDATRHGASTTGLRAWLSFTGTGVRVIGTLGPSDKNGQPTTTYSIDGKVVGTYSGPLVPSGQTQYNVTFFSARDLSPGDHIVLINNTDGTSPNVFWLDYFLIDPLPSATSSQGSTVETINPQPFTESNSPPLTGPTPGNAVPTGTTSAGTTSPLAAANTNASESGSSHSHSDAGVIAGATVAGVAVLAILATVFFCLRRRRRPHTLNNRLNLTVVPFAPHDRFASRTSHTQPYQPSMRYSMTHGGTVPVPPGSRYENQSLTAPPTAPPESVFSQSEFDTPSATSGAALLAPIRRTGSPPHTPPQATPIISEKSQSRSALFGTSPDPTSITPSPRTMPDTLDAPSVPHTPASPAFSASSTGARSPLMPPAAILPPGEWHAPPGEHSRAHALLRNLFSRGPRAGSTTSGSVRVPRDVDSGLRLYDDVVLPPPYTQD
ncbi:hypothetical protein C8Q77DRAFT_1244263 [Trametes polyzona]|nr:hypothetical protein C8Q77DRAFT_1244263 [Trametes polyzona]